MPPALRAGYALLQREQFDAILSTAHPPSVHVIGWMLAKKSGLPWIADYRDPWAGNAYVRHGFVRLFLERLLERGMLHRASAITTISEPIAAKLREFHRRRDVRVVPNAYDPADWDGVPDAVPQRFDLCFTGSMYDGKRSPDLLFEALAQLRSEGDPAASAARIHFYGPNSSNVQTSASRFGLNLQVRQHGMVPRSAALRAQRCAAALLIFLNMDNSTAGEMGSKYLEYMGARRPIIAIGPKDSVMREFIERSGTGWFASNVDECKQAIRHAHQSFACGMYELHREVSMVPTARTLARRFAEILDEATSHAALRGIA
jgi:glycosyltransferase involved in cell wall biosynthesis